ncbi:adenylyltransferase/cytidyltransferase family protein [Actinomyces bowdenii]|uniref:Adenylyltransferase/cytidyltransferase family protein n=1 Tax=Actinomyces bowdenii TaxID=131109 RepID=A0A853ELA4_9ACTO|nr:adenylyltransferase/cytidyltransferase family protein [Actinomyces bowdenii]MBF0696809.1 adenylyltransferase/cytidyltransferase family protein [Actinomyces bowdenii]NYS68982.1 adenylyltransferase/cytidyltransferase family protein [Actinomyces bowdenii]
MKRVMTYGTFDLLHYGHIELLRRARALGDHLVVGLSTDEFNAVKGKRARYGYDERAAMIAAVRYVDLVVPEATWEQKPDDVAAYGIEVVVLGQDWQGAFDDQLEGLCELVYLPRTPEVSTTRIKDYLLGAKRDTGEGRLNSVWL